MPPMLTVIREKIQGIVAGLIVGLIVIVFATWGINSYFEGGSKVMVAEGDGVKIDQDQLNTAAARIGSARGFPASMVDNPIFKQNVLNSLIAESLFLRDIDSRRYGLSDKQLHERIRSMPNFQVNGNFSPVIFERFLSANGISTAELVAQLRSEEIGRQIQRSFVESVIVTKDEVDQILKLKLQQRKFAYLTIDGKSFAKKISPSKEAIEQYYNSHTEQFMDPEQVQLEYIELSATDLAGNYEPSLEELRAAYDGGMVQTVQQPAKRRLSHILIEAGEDATIEARKQALSKIQELEKQLRQGASFAALAKKHSQDSSSAVKGGDLGDLVRGQMVKPFEDAALALKKKGEISKPVRTIYGYHLIKLTAYTPPVIKSFSQVRSEIATALKRQYGENRFDELIDSFNNLIFEHSDSLKPAADELGLKIKKTAWFGRGGGTGIAADRKVVGAAFEPDVLDQGRNSDAIEIGDTAVVAVRVAARREAKAKPLAQVSSQIKAQLQQQQALEQSKQMLEQVLQGVQQGKSLSQLAQAHGLAYRAPVTVTRDKIRESKLNPRLLQAVFAAPQPQGGKAVHESAALSVDESAVFALLEVVPGDASKADAALRSSVLQTLRQQRGRGYYENYRNGLRKAADIKIYSENL